MESSFFNVSDEKYLASPNLEVRYVLEEGLIEWGTIGWGTEMGYSYY